MDEVNTAWSVGVEELPEGKRVIVKISLPLVELVIPMPGEKAEVIGAALCRAGRDAAFRLTIATQLPG